MGGGNMIRMFAVLFVAPAAHAQVGIAPVGAVTQSFGFRFLTPQGFAYGYRTQTRPVWGFVAVPPPPIVVVVNPPPRPFPILPPEPETFQRDPIQQAKFEDAVKRGDFVVVKPRGEVEKAPQRPNPPAMERPPEEPKARSRYLVEKAREAFLMEEPGRAAERLQKAIALNPAVPLPYFLLAQVHVTLGQYPEAVAAIRDGMRLQPDWPAAKFDPTQMYSRPEFLDPDLQRLKKASEANPDDPALLFLLGYQWFFLGDRKEAAKLFKKASVRTRENAIIERFLVETMS
jgi:hypothetical protein